MGKISSYGIANEPSLGDKLIGTSVGSIPVNGTFNFTLQQLLDLFIPLIPSDTLQEVLNAGNNAIQDITLEGDITLVDGNILVKDITVNALFKDRLGLSGTAGQVLSSTGLGTEWIDSASAPNLQAVLDTNNTATQDINLTGTIDVIGNVDVSNFIHVGTSDSTGAVNVVNTDGDGVHAVSDYRGHGVYGESSTLNYAGVYGYSELYNGVTGATLSGTGVAGFSNADTGVFASSQTGTALYAVSQSGNHMNIGTNKLVLKNDGTLCLGTSTQGASKLRIVGLPTSATGLISGDVWNNGGVLTIV